MRIFKGINSILLFILIAGSLMISLKSTTGFAEEWRDMPPLVLNDCINVDKVLAPNPLSSSINDFWMVLKYEEKDENSGETKLINPAQILNMYLVTGLALMASEGVGLPYYQFLIVTLINGNGESSSKTVYQWLLSDTDNDGRLDKAKFERTVTGNAGETMNLDKMDIPDEQVQGFQHFYEEATRELNSKAEDESPKQCLVS